MIYLLKLFRQTFYQEFAVQAAFYCLSGLTNYLAVNVPLAIASRSSSVDSLTLVTRNEGNVDRQCPPLRF